MDYKANPKYKDRLFCFLFGNEKYKKNALSLYNTLNGTSYSDEEELEITTLNDVIYIRMRNDVSFLISGSLSLYEQQSSFNPNMPIRGFMYFARLYDKYITERHLNVYGRKRIALPTPGYVVLYNGNEQRPAVEKLCLSDAFIHPDTSGGFEWTATVLNLNHPDNQNFLKKCRPLGDYMQLVSDIKRYQGQNRLGLTEAVDRAVTECIARGGEMAEFLLAHRAEVVDMVLTEFDEEAFVRDIRAEGVEEGFVQGREQGREQGRAQEREQSLRTLVASLKKFVESPRELYELIIANDYYKDLSFDEIKALW
ncbi:MAG: hypothetical protein K2O03_11230 [Lachnospiraceae bacterium]|nr:hypothetical protein [Lachnospiraceae bacterium]